MGRVAKAGRKKGKTRIERPATAGQRVVDGRGSRSSKVLRMHRCLGYQHHQHTHHRQNHHGMDQNQSRTRMLLR